MRALARKDDRCFRVTEALKVTLDGQPMKLTFAGGPARPTAVSGVAMLPNGCAPPTWRIVTPNRPSRSTVEFELHGGRGRMVIDHLLTRRTLAMPQSARAGAPLSVRWTPAVDQWAGQYANVTVYRTNEFSKEVLGTYDQGAIRFTMPVVSAGPVRIDVRPQHPVRPPVVECGLGACTVGAVTSWPAPITVVP
jgi:hypothetical protein